MQNNEEQELRNAAKYLRQKKATERKDVAAIPCVQWAAMLERAADRIADLEAHLERLVA